MSELVKAFSKCCRELLKLISANFSDGGAMRRISCEWKDNCIHGVATITWSNGQVEEIEYNHDVPARLISVLKWGKNMSETSSDSSSSKTGGAQSNRNVIGPLGANLRSDQLTFVNGKHVLAKVDPDALKSQSAQRRA